MLEIGYIFHRGNGIGENGNVISILTTRTENRKIGDMFQTWHINADVPINESRKLGLDEPQCGDCALRPAIADDVECYLDPRGLAAIWKSYKMGKYKEANTETLADIVRGHFVRCGAYGDPATVPFDVWAAILPYARGFTGYTHQWPRADFDWRLKTFFMLSIDYLNTEEYARAKEHNARSYRILKPNEQPRADEILCPHSSHGIQCADCLLCAGDSRPAKSIVIRPHGTRSRAHS